MGGVPSALMFRPRTRNVVYISNPVTHYEIEGNHLKFYGMVGEEPIAIFLADYIFICEKILLGLSVMYYSPVTCDCTTYCFTSFSSQIFGSLSDALNEFTFRGTYSERTIGSEGNDDCREHEDQAAEPEDPLSGPLSQTDPTL
jgi:hypothetical protein